MPQKGSYIWNNTKKAYERRYLLTQNTELFKTKLIASIKRRKATHVEFTTQAIFITIHIYVIGSKLLTRFQMWYFMPTLKAKNCSTR
jgi:hypothetical protein